MTSTPDVLEHEPPQRPRRVRPLLVVAVAAALVAAVAIGAFALVSRVGLGLGDRPEAAVPDDALAFVRVDLDPQAGQKVNAFQFLRRFDALRDALPDDSTDLRKLLVDALDSPDLTWADVEPWLGDRMAIAVLPGSSGSSTPYVVGVLASRDDDAARRGLRAIADRAAGPSVASRVQDGWAYVSDTQAAVDAAARAGQGGSSLGDSSGFRDVLDAVGADSPVVGYADLDRAGALLADLAESSGGFGGTDPSTTALTAQPALARSARPARSTGSGPGAGTADALREQLRGRVAFGLRFEPDRLELRGVTDGVPGTQAAPVDSGATLATAPRGALVALHASGLGASIADQWDRVLDSFATSGGTTRAEIDRSLASLEQETGLDLPGDLEALLGEHLVAALAPDGLAEDGEPTLGAVVTTDAQRAEGAVKKVVDYARTQGAEVDDWPLTYRTDGDRFLIGTDAGYLERFGQGDTLGDDPRVESAVADLSGAQFALWADLDAVSDLIRSSGSEPSSEDDRRVLRVLEQLDSLGAATTVDGARTTSTVRLLAD